MPFSNHPLTETADNQTPPSTTVLAGRYALVRCMAETALGKIYWACDQQHPQPNEEECNNVLLFTILPAIAQNSVFEQALRQVLPAYQQDIPAQPHVIDNGKEADGTRWMVLKNIRGMLLAERLQELDDRGMPQDHAMEILHGLSQAVGDHRPQGVFGFLEPGAVLADEHHRYCLLGAPVAAALRLASTGIITTPDNRQTFHSGFISPEVALGDQPTSRDDTFSLACIAYNLLQGHPPFGQQTTLEALLRNFAPPSINKLKPEAWAALQQGLNLKRERRQATPPALLMGLQASKRPRLLLPIAALSVASLVTYASYHLFVSSDAPPASQQDVQRVSPIQTPAIDVPTGISNPSLVAETNPPAALEQESVQATSTKRAAENAAQAEETARIESIKREAEAQATAELALAEAAKTEAQQQTTLETQAEPPNQEYAKASQYIERANQAIGYGNLMQGDNRSGSAADYIGALFDAFPNHPEGTKLLEKVVRTQQGQANSALRKGDTDNARKLLNDSQKLIGQYTLDNLVEEQLNLEQRYRDVGMMGIIPAGTDLPPAPRQNTGMRQPPEPRQDTGKPAAQEQPANTPPTVTADKPENPVPVDTQTATPPETALTETPAEPSMENAAPTEPPPVQEVPVPPDVPVTETPPVANPTATAEMPPVQLDAAPVTEFTMPPAAAVTGNSFTPDVSGITELPLELGTEPAPAQEGGVTY